MNRCTSPAPFRWLLAGLAALALNALAQSPPRDFPPRAQRATLVILAAPDITLDGQPDRLSPGARIHSAQNRLLMSGTLIGQPLVVNYTREISGMVHEVWLLTPQEVALKRAGDASGIGSDYPTQPNLQVPFDQLPRYKP